MAAGQAEVIIAHVTPQPRVHETPQPRVHDIVSAECIATAEAATKTKFTELPGMVPGEKP